MAIKELFYDNRPRVLLAPRASQRIDPRFTFTRDSTGTFVDGNGIVQTADVNGPRFDHDPVTGESLGLLIEESRTNLVDQSQDVSTWASGRWTNTANSTTAPDGTLTGGLVVPNVGTGSQATGRDCNITSGTVYSASIYAKAKEFNKFGLRPSSSSNYRATFLLSGEGSVASVSNGTASIKSFPDGWYFCTYTYTEQTGGRRTCGVQTVDVADGTSGFYVWGMQLEEGSFPSSYNPTSGTAVTRSPDLLSIEAPQPATGSVYIDARAIGPEENDTLLSLKNDSNDKIDLAYLSNAATYDSLALIASYDGASKPSLPLPVPTTDRERNIITYGANNYQYGRDTSRFAPSLSSSVPSDLNKLSIGHDAVDATKTFSGYINTVYAWSGELTPEVAEALVRGEIDAINADTYAPVGPAGSLALVINTQGATADGEKTFTLPAESDATDNDIVITWGDGTESGLSNAAAELGAIGLTHDYPSAGIYPVWVEGKMQNIKYNNISNADDLLLIAEWGTGDMLTAPSTMNGAFYGCSQMDFSSSARNTNRPDTSAVTDWANAFRDCSSITGTFPSFDFTAATDFSSTWNGCSSLASMPAIFVADSEVTQNVTSFSNTWNGCSSLTSFPLINTSSATDFRSAWINCSGLTSFPLINTSLGTNFSSAWSNCSGLTSFPLINTASATNLSYAWNACSSLTSFPLINTSLGTNFNSAWSNCSSLNNIGVVPGATTSFPLIDTSLGTDFSNCWGGCSNFTSFPLIDTSSGTKFSAAWFNCSNLTDFPAGFFDSWAATPVKECFNRTWGSCSSLTATSVDNILVSIAASAVSAPSGTEINDKNITIDYDGTTLPGTTATAITTLKSRNWDIYLNGVQQ